MISLSATVFDPQGHMVIADLPGSEFGEVARRCNRVATLDADVGVVFNDAGHFPGDRTFRVLWRPTSHNEYRRAQRLLTVYPFLRVAAREGVFLCKPESLSLDGDEATLVLLVAEKVS